MSSVATRLPRMSFIGRRPIIFKNSEVTFSIQQLSNAAQSIRNLKFGTLPFTQTALVSGRLGAFNINITDGLDCKLSEAFTPEETKICLSVNAEKYLTMNKYQQKFLRSMYGTTNSILARFIEGVSEVPGKESVSMYNACRDIKLHCSLLESDIKLRLSLRA
mgnify:CR=1 FL=1